ncbi:Free fatty acid receptor 3, partial [Tyto alba]
MLVLTVYILTFSVGFPANVFTFVTLLGKARQRISSSDILLLNLTAADLVLPLFLPFKMAEAAAGMTWPLPVVLCPVANFCFYSSIYLSSLFLAALSVERYLGVVFPLQISNPKLSTPDGSNIRDISGPTDVSQTSNTPSPSSSGVHDDSNTTDVYRCYDDFSEDQLSFVLPLRLELFLVLFLLPFTITIFCYINFVRVLVSRPNIP